MAIAGKCHHTQEPFQRLPTAEIHGPTWGWTKGETSNKYGKANANSHSTLIIVRRDYEYGLWNDKNLCSNALST